MKSLWFIICGVLGGILAGMGMGGGKLTIPLLVLVLGVGQSHFAPSSSRHRRSCVCCRYSLCSAEK